MLKERKGTTITLSVGISSCFHSPLQLNNQRFSEQLCLNSKILIDVEMEIYADLKSEDFDAEILFSMFNVQCNILYRNDV